MSFVYKRVTIPLDCLKSLWTLTLGRNEWGGRFKVRGDMSLDCNLDLIKGTTKQEEVGENSHLYLGEEAYDENKRLKPVKMASLSFSYEDYTGTSPQKINVIFHTHPLLLVRDDDTHIARIALPSLGDLFAHCVYSNLENQRVNGHLNGYIVVAFEGAYVYNIMPHKFAQLRDTYNRLLKQHTQDDAIDILKKQVFDALRPINKRFFSDMKAMCDARPDLFGTEGAPDIQNSMWTCKGCEPHELDFPFAEGIHTSLVQPGQPGFNAYAQSLMQKAKVLAAGDDVRCVNAGDPPYDQPYQRTIAYLAHPKSSPDYRMLVAHRTGSGKTLGMIRVLSNFFNDPRPKVAIFPKEDVKINFYRSIMTFDNPYRDYVLKRTRMDPQTALANLDLVVKTLSMHGHPQRAGSPGYLAAPLRAFSYNEIGGSSLNQYRWFHPFTPCGTTDRGAQNRWCDKIVVMDEAHNLVKPTDESKFKLSVSKANLGHARDALRRATRTVLVLFTATPMIDDIEDIDAMLSIVKGHGNEELNDEGFVSAFYGAPVSSYPRVEPDEREIPRMIRVELTGDGDDKDTALGSYLTKLLNAKGQVQRSFMEKNTRDVYDYTPKYFSQQAQASFLASLRTEGARDIVPKLWAAAKYIESAEGKVIVLTAKRHGFFTLDALLRTNPRFASISTRALLGSGISTNRSDWKASLRARSGATDQAILKAFNGADNVNGERLKALVLNADSYSEGVDFKDVRHVVLLDIAPKWATILQRVGRAVRHCSHQRLPPEKRTVKTVVMVASLPAYARFRSRVVDLRRVMTVDEQHIVKVIRDRAVIEKRMCDLMASAVDAPILSSAMAKGCGPVSDAVKVDYKPILRLSPEETEQLRECVKKYERCVSKAINKYLEVSAKDDWMSHGYKKPREEFMQRKMEHCKGVRNVCEEKIMGPEEERDFGRNCPPLYNQETCDYYCEHQLGLRGKDFDKCVRREHGGQSQYYYANAECPHNLPCSDNPEDTANRMAPGWGMPLAWISSWFTPNRQTGDSVTPLRSPGTAQVGSAQVGSPQTSTSMEPCEVCPEGLSDEHCFEHCINSGLVHGDLYRCVARQQRAKCEHEFLEHQQKPEAKPAGAAGSERLVNPSTGKMVKRGGATHKRLCNEGIINDCTGVNTAAKRRKSGRRASSRKRSSRASSRKRSSGRRRRSSRPRSPTVPELKKRCKDAGITGYSKLRKADLMKKCL